MSARVERRVRATTAITLAAAPFTARLDGRAGPGRQVHDLAEPVTDAPNGGGQCRTLTW